MDTSKSQPKTQEERERAWRKLRNEVLMRDGGRCRFCDSRDAKLIARVSYAAGPSGYVTACGPCLHAAKGLALSGIDTTRDLVRYKRRLDAPATSIHEESELDPTAHLTRRELRKRKKVASIHRAYARNQQRGRAV